MQTKSASFDMLKAYRSTRYTAEVTSTSIFNFLQSLDCPRALSVWILYSSGEHAQLTALEVDPEAYLDGYSFRDAYTATMFLSKADFLKPGFDKKSRAFEKFRQFEAHCGVVNQRFRDLSSDPSYRGHNVPLLSAMIRKIDEVLSSFDCEEFVDGADWGPGSTTLLKGAEVSAFNKFRDEHGITRDLYRLVRPWFSMAYPQWSALPTAGENLLDGAFHIEPGNYVVTVPKNSKTDRVIAIEPGINTWFQKSIGSMIRRRLKKHGIDLDHQDRNQSLCRESAITGHLATVDFSSASDSISKWLVRVLIRDARWLTLLEASRCKYGKLDGSTFKWNKFSSMGNGYTFELESLIFYAAAIAVCEFNGDQTHEVSVFGDDVIIPSTSYELFSQFTDFLGFKVNREKSFCSSPFRESCGVHYYEKIDCKPVFLKGRPQSVPGLFRLANSVRLLAHRRHNFDGCDVKFLGCWSAIVDWIPSEIRLGIPVGYGDGGLVTNFDEAHPSVKSVKISARPPRRAGRGFEGFRFASFFDEGVSLETDHPALLSVRLKSLQSVIVRTTDVSNLYSLPKESYVNSYTLRSKVRVKLIPDVLARQWYNIGPWK